MNTKDLLYDLSVELGELRAENKHLKKVVEAVKKTHPERMRGEWIDYTEDGYVECPFCHSATNCDGDKNELHF